jgi:cytochrome P450
VYNISPLHPLAKYPGPLLWRSTRLFASYHHASGTLYKRIAEFHETYGPTVRIAPDELSFTNPEAWPQIYNTRPQLAKSKFHFGSQGDRKVPESMIMASDQDHTRLRRLVNPAFLYSGVLEVEPVLQQYTELLCSQLGKVCENGSSAQNIGEWYLWALNDVIGHLALDLEFECLEKRRMHPWPHFLLGALKQTAVITQLARFGISMKMLMPLMTKEMRAKTEDFAQSAISAISQRLARAKEEENARADGNPAAAQKSRQDIIGMMMREMKGGERLTEEELTVNSILIVGGGAETTATCLTATTYHLCKTPRVMQKLQEEIRSTFASPADITVKATGDLSYLNAVVSESLRAFPVASYITPRVAPKGGVVVDGNVIPEGTYMTMGQWYMGRSATHFDNPRDFIPERWFQPGADATQSGSGLRVDEILRPFSLGPRNCIGKILALAEVKLVLAKLLWSFDLELAGGLQAQDDWVEGARFFVSFMIAFSALVGRKKSRLWTQPERANNRCHNRSCGI